MLKLNNKKYKRRVLMLKRVYTLLFTSSLLLAAPTVNHSINKNQVKKDNSKKSKNLKVVNSNNKKYKDYTVKSGDTLFSIARKFKVSISDINKINKLSGNLIHPGDTLKVPNLSYVEKAKKAVETNKKTVYKIKKGDTLISIAKKFDMKVDDIRKLNSFKKGKILIPGTEINVYAKKATIDKRKKVTKVVVKSGDTLWSIAKKYNLTMSEIRLLNPRVKTRGLRRGMILNVSKQKAIKLAKLAKKRKKKRLKGVLARYKRSYSTGRSVGSNTKVVRYAKRFLGTRYVWGASSGRAFDCSGFTQYVMRHAKGRVIPRISRRQAYYGRYVSRSRLRAGDLVFFDTSRRRRGYVNHVGIYIGNNYFIHASSAKHRVVITSLNKPFYRQRFMWGRRIN
jgi:cell wall-associated NlpC family hydrolase